MWPHPQTGPFCVNPECPFHESIVPDTWFEMNVVIGGPTGYGPLTASAPYKSEQTKVHRAIVPYAVPEKTPPIWPHLSNHIEFVVPLCSECLEVPQFTQQGVDYVLDGD